jgi:hypothetical protein
MALKILADITFRELNPQQLLYSGKNYANSRSTLPEKTSIRAD